MARSFLPAKLWEMLLRRRPVLLYAAAWTALITAAVAVAAFTPELAFVWAVSPSSSFASGCGAGAVRLPLDGPPGEVVCVPAQLFGRPTGDLFVPPLFAALVVTSSVCFIRAIGLWEEDEDEDEGEEI